jgi:carbamoyltransferase
VIILGINAYHGGASACLIKDGQIVAAAEEERFKRVKYWAGFPVEAIRYCLDEAGISVHEVEHIGISRDPGANLRKKILYVLSSRPSLRLVHDRLSNAARVQGLRQVLGKALDVDASGFRAELHSVEHHRAHMASAFFVSPYREAAILSVDGMGDFVSTMWGVGRDNSLEVMGSISFPHSLGNFYTMVTQWLGFPKYGDEGKVMGLAPYGQPVYLDQMRKIVRLQRDGTFELDLDYLAHGAEGATMTWGDGAPTIGRLYTEKLVELLGPPRQPRTEITEHQRNVAASLQAMLEEAEFGLVEMLQRSTNQTALCMAGGVALNSSFNGKILPNTAFDDIYIHPAAGDAGTALGVCFYIYHQLLGQPRTCVLDHAYTGPRFENGRIAERLDAYGLRYEELDDGDLVRRTAALVAQGKVTGWFQGRMEWGPRALGNRSIIADPRQDDMKDILNARIKYRESFRPFAPSILGEAVSEYFDQSYPDPFMLKVYNVLPE